MRGKPATLQKIEALDFNFGTQQAMAIDITVDGERRRKAVRQPLARFTNTIQIAAALRILATWVEAQ